jgi:hypothetical protein
MLGSPIPGSSNPYIAGVVGRAAAYIAHERCGRVRVSVRGLPQRVGAAVKSYWARMLEDSGIGACTRVEVASHRGLPPSGLYSAVTAFLVRSMVSPDGGDPMEVVEVARHADQPLSEWPGVIDALRLASLYDGLVVYRNEEEYFKVSSESPRGLGYKYSRTAREPRLLRDRVGAEVYSALIHLMGVSVVEAARGVMEGLGVWESLSRFLPIHSGVTEAVWGVRTPEGECVASPGLPGRFEVLCRGV